MTGLGRVILALTPGMLGLPSSQSKLPGPAAMISGSAMRTARPRSVLQSTTARRSITPICGAARPTPGIASIVAIMSSQIARMSSVTLPTGSAGVRSRLSGQGTKGLTGIIRLQRAPRLGGNPVEGHDPVEMVLFVLRADRRRTVESPLMGNALGRCPAQDDPGRAWHLGRDAGDRQARLRPRDRLGRMGDDGGVHADERVGGAVLPRDIHDEQPDRMADLRRGK